VQPLHPAFIAVFTVLTKMNERNRSQAFAACLKSNPFSIGLLATLVERVELRAQSIQSLKFEAAWPDVPPTDKATLKAAIAILERLNERDLLEIET
jgi:hypothetical protein